LAGKRPANINKAEAKKDPKKCQNSAIWGEKGPKSAEFGPKSHPCILMACRENMLVDLTRFERWNVHPY
jgi:hypothetical protein